MWKDEIKLGFGHSLLLGNLPNKVTGEQYAQVELEKRRAQGQVIESFGLFDHAAPNFTTYYPDVTAEDLAPKDAEFIYPIYRALSEVIVHKNFNPVDFSKRSVLKDSLSLIVGQAVYPNHEAVVGNEVGSVKSAVWEESYKIGKITVPAGINVQMAIDGKSNPKLARGIMMDPPSVHSTSETVQFLWEKSHASMTEEDFFSKLGTYDEEGKLITRVASKILLYKELSFVSHGADAFAQKVGKNGKIVNPTYADAVYSLSAEEKKDQKFFFFDYKIDLISNSENTIPQKSNTEENLNEPTMDPKLLAFLTAIAPIVGVELKANEEPNEEAISLAIKTLSENHKTSEAEVTRLKAIETSYNANKDEITKLAELRTFKETTVSKLQAEVTEVYNKSTGNKPVEAVTSMIAASTDPTILLGLKAQYKATLEEKYPMACKKCGSHEVTRASTVKKDDDNNNVELSAEERMENLKRSKQGTFKLHEEVKG